MTPELPALLALAFPDLEADGGEVIGPADPAYNCVAWAVGVTDAVWWPGAAPDAYWPTAAPPEPTVAHMVAALSSVGYVECDHGELEASTEKVAVYARGGVATHVARQLATGRWTSKLGPDCLIAHSTPSGMAGAVYGTVAAYLRRAADRDLTR